MMTLFYNENIQLWWATCIEASWNLRSFLEAVWLFSRSWPYSSGIRPGWASLYFWNYPVSIRMQESRQKCWLETNSSLRRRSDTAVTLLTASQSSTGATALSSASYLVWFSSFPWLHECLRGQGDCEQNPKELCRLKCQHDFRMQGNTTLIPTWHATGQRAGVLFLPQTQTGLVHYRLQEHISV